MTLSPSAGDAWPAPAKLNLMLHITGRRPDGYHTLQTVFQLLDVGDTLDFKVREDGVIARYSEWHGVASHDDLIVKAATALQRVSGCRLGVDIRLTKWLPVGGGLGGGSSDAATTLVALNHLWALDCTVDELAEIGLQLGTDVPVFVHGDTAWASGVGEVVQAVSLPESWYLVITPDCVVSTASVFKDALLTRNTPEITMAHFLRNGGHNDCEALVCLRYPEVASALDWLRRFGKARLTGTGASVFIGFDQRQQAQSVYERRPEGWRGFVARGANVSPLKARLAREATLEIV